MATVPIETCADCGKPTPGKGKSGCCRSCATVRAHARRRGGGPLRGSITRTGYRRIKIKGRMVLEHRMVMEQHLGRPLTRDEVVHHKNGDRLDNRIENLELHSTHAEHLREHQAAAEWVCLYCGQTFKAKPCEGQKFCSRECHYKAQRGHYPRRGLSLGEPIRAGMGPVALTLW